MDTKVCRVNYNEMNIVPKRKWMMSEGEVRPRKMQDERGE